MLGEHGDGQVPVWSSVQIHGMAQPERDATVERLREGIAPADFAEVCARERREVAALLQAGRVADAFTRVDTLPPDVRVIVKPYITHLSGSKTVLATANVTVDLLSTLYDGREVLVAGQAMLHRGRFSRIGRPAGCAGRSRRGRHLARGRNPAHRRRTRAVDDDFPPHRPAGAIVDARGRSRFTL